MRFVFGQQKIAFRSRGTVILTSYKLQLVLMRLLLDLCFRSYVVRVFSVSNYQYAFRFEDDIVLYLLSWAVFLPSLVVSEKWYRSGAPSRTVLHFIYLIQFVPFTTMLGFSCFPAGFCIFTAAYWIMMAVFSFFLLKKETHSAGPADPFAEQTAAFEAAILVISGLTALYFGYISGFRINLSILQAYDMRIEARTVSKLPGSTYLLGASRILIPSGLIYAIRRKKLWMAAALAVFAALNYSFDGSKTLYFLCVVAVLTALFYNRRFNKFIPFFLNALLVLGFLESLVASDPLLYRLLIRRLFFVPNVINNAYYDHMLTHAPNMFSNLLRFFGVHGSYDIAFVVGDVYFHSPEMSANTGTVGDALWQFRYLGAIILPALIVLLLKLLDRCTRRVPFEMLIIPCLVFAYYLNNSHFPTACFSHGLVVFCLVMLLYRCRRLRRRGPALEMAEEA